MKSNRKWIITLIFTLVLSTWLVFFFFFFKQKTAYEMRISDWSSDVCSSDLIVDFAPGARSGIALDDDPHLYEIVAAPGRRVAAAGLGRHERGERHAQFGPAFLRVDRRGELAGERVDDEEIAPGAAHFEPDARKFARIDRSEEHTSELQSLMRISYADFCL